VNRLIKIFRVLMPSCREALRLQSAALDSPLPLLQRMGLKMHLMLCVWCSRYGRQIKFLRHTAQHCEHHLETAPPLSAEARQKIKRALAAQKS
jgi:hypothetical protein